MAGLAAYRRNPPAPRCIDGMDGDKLSPVHSAGEGSGVASRGNIMSVSQADKARKFRALHEAPGAFVMGNLLGDVWLAQGARGGELDLSAWARHPRVVDVYLYGKREPRPRRKMGHFVVHAPDADEALAAARAFRDDLCAARKG